MVKARYVDTGALENAISKSGLKTAYIVEKLGISKQAYYMKKKGEYAFRQSEVYVLCDLLKLTEKEGTKIFFPEKLGNVQT